MISSRRLEDLHPVVQKMANAHITACSQAGIHLLITSTFRDHASQDALYAQGRTAPGRKVTNARGGQSFHNYRVAYDVVPLRNGKPVWSTAGLDGELWKEVGRLGESVGLEWAGRWIKFREFPHFQFTGGKPLSHFQAGGSL